MCECVYSHLEVIELTLPKIVAYLVLLSALLASSLAASSGLPLLSLETAYPRYECPTMYNEAETVKEKRGGGKKRGKTGTSRRKGRGEGRGQRNSKEAKENRE